MDQKLINKYSDALYGGDIATVRAMTEANPKLLHAKIASGTPLHVAAYSGHTDVMEYLVSQGLDVNARAYNCPNRPLHRASAEGRLDAARWLLDHGADVNAGELEDFPIPMVSSVLDGNEPLVRLQLEQGAHVNATYGSPPKNALGFAIEYGHKNIETLLLSHGAIEPPSFPGDLASPEIAADMIVKHLWTCIGPVESLSQHQVVSDGIPIAIHVIRPGRNRPRLTLFTTGMSEVAMAVPDGVDAPRYGELVMYLPPDWPADIASMRDPGVVWPFIWLRNLARQVVESRVPEWLIVSSAEPPAPVCAGTQLSCFLLMPSELLGKVQVDDHRSIHFIEVSLLYEGERDLALRSGIDVLLNRLTEHAIDMTVHLKRIDVSAEDN